MNISFIVDGAAMEAEGGATYERKDPMTGKVATRAAAATLADVDKVVAAASAAFETWSQTGPGLRRALLLKAADLMEAAYRRFHQADAGGDRRDRAMGRLQRASRRRHSSRSGVADHPDRRRGDSLGQTRHLSMAIRQPAGVVLGIAPWNAPVILGIRAIAARAGLRQYRDPALVRDLPRHPSTDRPGPERCRLPQGRRQCLSQRARRRAEDRRGVDRPSRDPAHQFHRLDQGRHASSPSSRRSI